MSSTRPYTHSDIFSEPLLELTIKPVYLLHYTLLLIMNRERTHTDDTTHILNTNIFADTINHNHTTPHTHQNHAIPTQKPRDDPSTNYTVVCFVLPSKLPAAPARRSCPAEYFQINDNEIPRKCFYRRRI